MQPELPVGRVPEDAVRFGPFEFDPRAGELTKHGLRIRLQEQPFQVLRMLLARPGEIVLREELRYVLWPENTFGEFDHGINAAVKRLRDALGDSAETPRYIETVARRGYRFVATIDGVPGATCEAVAEEAKSEAPPDRPVKSRTWRALPAATMVVPIAAVLVYSFSHQPAPDIPRLRFSIEAPEDAAFTNIYGGAAVSPDGTLLAFTAIRLRGSRATLWIRPIDSLIPRELPGTQGALTVFWSADSKSIAFFAEGKLKTIPVSGATPQTLCHVPVLTDFDNGTWNRQGTLVFSSGGILHQVSTDGGQPTPLTTLDAARHEKAHGAPQFLPDGRRLLFVITSSDPNTAGVYETSLEHPDQRIRISATALKTLYVPPRAGRPGYLLWLREKTLVAQPFDLGRRRLSGPPSPVAENIAMSSNDNTTGFWASQTGLLVYRSGGADNTRMTWIARDGRIIEAFGREGAFGVPRISPDGSRVALRDRTDSGNTDIWIYEFKTGGMTRLTFDPAPDTFPVWSPDGRQLGFACGGQLCRISADGAGAPEHLSSGATSRYLWDWSRDGRYFLYAETNLQTRADLWIFPLEAGRSPIPFLRTPFHEFYGQFSPDGKWIAYTSDESGREEVYIRAAFRAGAKRQISIVGGTQPRWRRDGRELYYLTGANLMASRIRVAGPEIESDSPHIVFSQSNLGQTFYCYDVAPDGNRFLVLRPVGGSAAGALTVLSGW
jgi:Tol biopolymer transport system component/DNA-binding winged helix-turn-helix (wHTH) protein